MTPLQLTLPVSEVTPAVLTLPQPLTSQALCELEQAVSDTLGMLRRDLCGNRRDAADEAAAGLAARQYGAGEIEYASWLPDPGAIEVASWTAQLQTSLR